MRVLVFGDSITLGYWAPDGGWVERLRRHYETVHAQDLYRKQDPLFYNMAVDGDTSNDVLQRLGADIKTRTWRGNLPIVAVQTGLNDSLLEGGSEKVSLNDYKQNLMAIVEKARPLSSNIIFVGFSACDESKTTPVFWADIHYTNDRLKAYEDAMAEVAKSAGIPFIPVFEQFNAALAKDKSLLADGLHPSNAGHQLLYDIIRPQLEPLVT